MSSPVQTFFDRSWRLALEPAAGGLYVARSLVAKDEQPLRITFQTFKSLTLAFWSAEISIFNLSRSTAKEVSQGGPDAGSLWKFKQPVVAGDKVTLSAGYLPKPGGSFDAQANIIYTGQVLQPLWTREGVVDFVLKLRCITALAESALNAVSFTMTRQSSELDVVNMIAEKSGLAVDIDDAAQSTLAGRSYSRAQVVNGRPPEVLREISRGANLFSWINEDGLHVRSFQGQSLSSAKVDYAYGTEQSDYSNVSKATPIKKTLIGTPEQTQDGVTFRVLLDPTVKIGDTVQVAAGVLLAPYQFQYGKGRPAVTNQDGTYVVAGIRDVGDSRGDNAAWFTEITALSLNFFPDFLKTRTALNG